MGFSKWMAVVLPVVALVTSCSSDSDEDFGTSNQAAATRSVSVAARAGSAEGLYPLTLYAFNTADGSMVDMFTAASASDAPVLTLSEGSYKLVAMAGYEDLALPEVPMLNADMGVPESGVMSQALQVGRANVSVGKNDAEVEINMAYQVSQVNLTLEDIPEDVEEVSVSLSTMNAELTFDGTLSGSNTVVLDLAADADEPGKWSAPVAYVLPGASTQLALSISLTNATSTKTFGYTHASNLKAGVPYALTGSYKGTFQVSGIVSGAGWATAESIGFTFGPGVGDGDDETGTVTPPDDSEEGGDEEQIYPVTKLPSSEELWEGHFVAVKTWANAYFADLLLLSLDEYEITTAEASTKAATYSEPGLNGWHIPTEIEMQTISGEIGSAYVISGVNTALTAAGGVALTSSGKYLCEDAAKYVVMGSSTSLTSNATDKYRLRLVKTVRVQLVE
ncbi:MAG: FimB/Mfa2 family fimbrial subunit [Bacteroidaceae bacterium]|nr:FimB/Mfa2 family fimbrial subunit [Bacteroidaceae bacterium]